MLLWRRDAKKDIFVDVVLPHRAVFEVDEIGRPPERGILLDLLLVILLETRHARSARSSFSVDFLHLSE